jgi:hypothetical protein
MNTNRSLQRRSYPINSNSIGDSDIENTDTLSPNVGDGYHDPNNPHVRHGYDISIHGLKKYYSTNKYARYSMITAGVIFLLYIIVRIDLSLARAGVFDPDVTQKTMHIYSMPETLVTRAQGMFADFLAVIGALKYGLAHKAAAVHVHYDNPFYLDKARGDNWWAYFFDPVMPLQYPTAPVGTHGAFPLVSASPAASAAVTLPSDGDVHYTSYNARFGRIGSFSQVVTKGTGIEEDPALRPLPVGTRNDGSGVNGLYYQFPYPVNGGLGLEDVRKVVQAHVKVVPEVKEKVKSILKEVGIEDGDFVIGLHYRGLDKIDAYPFVPVPVDLYRQVVTAVVDLYKPASWKVYIATDTQDFVEWAKTVWGDHVAVRDISRIKLDDIEYQQDGTPMPLHKSEKVKPYDKAEGAVVDMLVLAACDYIVKNRSSLSDTSLAFMDRGQHYTFLLGPNDPVYSSDVRMPIYFRFNDDDFMAKKMSSLKKKKVSWFYEMITP